MLMILIYFSDSNYNAVMNQKKSSGFVGTALACTFRIMPVLLLLDCMWMTTFSKLREQVTFYCLGFSFFRRNTQDIVLNRPVHGRS